jgi:hypothetical protein
MPKPVPSIHILLLYLFISANFAFAQEKNGPFWAEETGGKSTYQKVFVPISSGYSEQDVRDAIYRISPIPEHSRSVLETDYVRNSPGGAHFAFRQTFNGLPVWGGGIKANLDLNGNIRSLMNHLQDFDPDIQGDFLISGGSIQQKYLSELQAYRIDLEAQFLIQDKKPVPVYRLVSFSLQFPNSLEILVDARNGQEISRSDRSLYHRNTGGIDTTGLGRIFLPDPCTKAEVAYGQLFTDMNDMALPVFLELSDTVVLRNISFRNGAFYLEGPYVRIEDILANVIPPASSPDGIFFYTRDLPGFEDVMCYYHIDTYQRYVQHLGFTNLYNDTLRVDPHGFGNNDNSQFTPDGANSYLRFGEGGVDDAEDADVIIHEYGHALSFAASPGTTTGTERRGIDEGIGDYLAASYSFDINPYRWQDVFSWDGHNEFWPGRSADVATTYTGPVGIYTNGEIYASAMMRVRQEIGAEASDRIFLQELYGNTAFMTVPDAANLLLDADTALYGGVHSPSIIKHFCNANILSGAICSSVGIDPGSDTFSGFRVFPNPSSGRIKVEGPLTGNIVNMTIFDMQGREMMRFNWTGNASREIDTQLPAGCYLLRFDAGNSSQSQKIIITPK